MTYSKVVRRLLTVPAVVWEKEIHPILKALGIPPPKQDFNPYKWIDIDLFVKDASPAFWVKLTSSCLKRGGIKVGFDNQPFISLDGTEANTSAIELLRSIQRHNDDIEAYEKQKLVRMPESFVGKSTLSPRGIRIIDVDNVDDTSSGNKTQSDVATDVANEKKIEKLSFDEPI